MNYNKPELLDQRTSDSEKTCTLLLELHNRSTLPPPDGSISKLQEKLLTRRVNKHVRAKTANDWTDVTVTISK